MLGRIRGSIIITLCQLVLSHPRFISSCSSSIHTILTECSYHDLYYIALVVIMFNEPVKLTFEPNDLENQLLGARDDAHALRNKIEVQVNKEVITDEEISKCIFSTRTLFVQYGTLGGKDACLIGFEFTFHAFNSRFKKAEIDICFQSSSPLALVHPRVALVSPKMIDGDKSEATIQKALTGQLQLGYESVSIMGNATYSKESKQVYHMSIRGSKVGESGARWTLVENPDQKDGIPHELVGYVLVQNDLPFRAEVDVDATIGRLKQMTGSVVRLIDYIRQILFKKKTERDNWIEFDLQTAVDYRVESTKPEIKIENWTPRDS